MKTNKKTLVPVPQAVYPTGFEVIPDGTHIVQASWLVTATNSPSGWLRTLVDGHTFTFVNGQPTGDRLIKDLHYCRPIVTDTEKQL